MNMEQVSLRLTPQFTLRAMRRWAFGKPHSRLREL